MPIKNPPHPGEIIRELCLKPLNLSVTAAAKALAINRVSLSELLNGKNGLTPEMAYRLYKAFGSTPEFWLRLQMAFELAKTRKNASKLKIKRLKQSGIATQIRSTEP